MSKKEKRVGDLQPWKPEPKSYARVKELNQKFFDVMVQPVKANTEMQIACEKHGEVFAYCNGNEDLYCPVCYNDGMQKVEAMYSLHIDKNPRRKR